MYDYYNDNAVRDDGMLYQLTDPRGKVWEYGWDQCSLQSIQTPEGWDKFNRTINQYTGLVDSQQDPNNKTSTFSYDALGRLTTIDYPIENDVVTSYNQAGGYFDNVKTSRGDAEVIEYFDDLGRVKAVRKKMTTSGDYSYIFYEYDLLGRKSFESEPTANSSCSGCPGTSYLYDALGRVTEMATPDGTYSYAYDGDITVITNPDTTTKTIVKDPFGNIVELTDEGSNLYSFVYDALNNLKTIDGPGTNDRTFDYDGAGRLWRETHPESGQTTYTLDDNGNITRKTFHDTTYLEQTFDDNNRLTQKYFSKDLITIGFTYDGSTTYNLNGQLASQTFPEGSIEYNRYDDLGKIKEVEYRYTGVGNFTIEYDYDNNSNMRKLKYPTLPTYLQVLSYDAGNRVKSITDYVDSIEYNPAGGIEQIDYGNGVSTSIPTSPSLRNRPDYISVVKGSTLMRLDYQYNSMGNVDRIKRSPNSLWDTFQYDELNRLERVDYVSPSEYLQYSYDEAGNPTAFSSDITEHPAWSLTYLDNQVSTAGYTYDGNGNLTHYPAISGGNKTLTYGYENNIVTATLDTNPTVSFSYDGFGRRIKKSKSGFDIWYLHDRNGNLIMEIDTNDSEVTKYIYAGSFLIAKRTDPLTSLPSGPVPVEVSEPGASVPFSLSKSGSSLVFRFAWKADASAYHIYGLTDELSMDAGSYSTKFCDLENNSFGSWQTDGATWCEWTLTDGSLLPSETFVVIAENGNGEGVYGLKSGGTIRTPDSDGVTPSELDCGVSTQSIQFYHLDHLGNVCLMTDDIGDVVWPEDYSSEGPARYLPFGELYKYSTRQYDTVNYNTELKFTGKEFDSETELSYFGARYVEHVRPPRFPSPDPSLSRHYVVENPQTFNLYTYSNNNPLKYIDPNGEWPEEVHNAIIDKAFSEGKHKLSSENRAAIKEGSIAVDTHQEHEESYMHAMTGWREWETVEDAQKKMIDFINGKVNKFKVLMEKGGKENEKAAYFTLGEALHPLMDSTSPSHEGFQEWRGLITPLNSYMGLIMQNKRQVVNFIPILNI